MKVLYKEVIGCVDCPFLRKIPSGEQFADQFYSCDNGLKNTDDKYIIYVDQDLPNYGIKTPDIWCKLPDK